MKSSESSGIRSPGLPEPKSTPSPSTPPSEPVDSQGLSASTLRQMARDALAEGEQLWQSSPERQAFTARMRAAVAT